MTSLACNLIAYLCLIVSSVCPPDPCVGQCPPPYTFLGLCPQDLDLDGSVGGLDLLALLAAYETNDPCDRADLNGDRDVNVTDLLDLLGHWGACPSPTIVPISGCRELSEEGTTYVLEADVPDAGADACGARGCNNPDCQAFACFEITAPGIVLDGDGHTIIGPGCGRRRA